MNPISRRTIEKSLSQKGFKPQEASHHRYYYLYYDEKKYPIHTKISRGSTYREYGIHLLKLMKKRLKLDSLGQTYDLLQCPMTHEEYIGLLKKKGELE